MAAGATYEPIATSTVTGSVAANITFSSISSTYTDLRLVVVARQDSGLERGIYVQLNADTGTNYSSTQLYGSGSAAGSSANSSFAYWPISTTSSTANVWTLGTCDIFSYAGSTNKTALSTESQDGNGSGYVWRRVHLWRSTSAINSIKIYPQTGSLAIDTTATLYGIKAA